MRISIYIIIISIMYSAIPLVNSITIPSDKSIPEVPNELKNFVYTGQLEAPKPPIYTVAGGAEGKTQYVQVPETPVLITKSMLPLNDNGYYHVGDVVGVFVEAENRGHTLRHIDIKEFVDNGIGIINTSKNCYLLRDLNEISSYESSSNKDYYLDIDNCTKSSSSSIHYDDSLNINTYYGDYLFNLSGYDINSIKKFLKEELDIEWLHPIFSNTIEGKILCIKP